MSKQSANNKRIAKNTIFLYFRMILLMGVSFYTSRVVLSELGVENYGIYNVVGGLVSMLSFIYSSLSGANSRFLAASIGEKKWEELKSLMACIKTIHWGLAIIVLVLAEIFGLWFLYHKLVIPEVRMSAALWCFHFSVITVFTSIISIPYNSLIIARERMDYYAYVSIIDAILRLSIVFLLDYQPFDKLIAYGFLVMLVQVCMRFMYLVFCNTYFEESKVQPQYSKEIFSKILKFSSFAFIGNISSILYNQGLSLMLNTFFGPIVNAARAIALQVQGGCSSLVVNFQMAIQPQITKTWVNGEKEYNHALIVYSSKFSYYLTSILVFPILYSTHELLELWLVTVPDYSLVFVRIALLCTLLEAFSHEMIAAVHATGNIGRFHICEGIVLLTILPITYICLKCFSVKVEHIMWVYFIIQFLAQCIRMKIALPQIDMSFSYYCRMVILPIFFPTLLYIVPIVCVKFNIDSWEELMLLFFSGVFYICMVSYLFGLKHEEKRLVNNIINKQLKKLWKK